MESPARERTTRRTGQTRSVPWVPVVLATCISVPALALSTLMWLVAVALMPSMSVDLPADVTVIQPSDRERALGIARHVTPLVLGAGLLALTWLYGLRGRSRLCWACAIGAGLVSIASVL